MGETRPGAQGSRGSWVEIILVATVAVLVASSVVFSWFNRRLLIPDPSTWEKGRLVTAVFDPPTSPVELFHNQGDGQFFVHGAQDPFLRSPERIRGGPNEQAYRLQRPLFGWLGWLASGGEASRAAWAMVVVTVLSVGLLAAVAAALAQARGYSGLWGLAVLTFPGVYMNLLRCGPEVLGTALLGLGWLAVAPRGWMGADRREERGRPEGWQWALVWFALAGLTRESFLLVPVVLAMVTYWGQSHARKRPENLVRAEIAGDGISAPARFGDWAWPLGAVLPWLIWVAILRLVVGGWPRGSGGGERMASVPFGGLAEGVGAWRAGEWVSFALVIGTALVGAFLSRCRTERALVAAHLGFSATFGYVVWATWAGFSRVLLPLSLIGLVATLRERGGPPPDLTQLPATRAS